jgi:hypothetical protein
MAARHRDRIDGLRTQLIGHLAKLVRIASTQVFRGVYEVEQRRFRGLRHRLLHDGLE